MRKLQKSALLLTSGLALLAASSSANAMDRYVENALIDTCRTALTDKPYKLRKTIDSYHMKMRSVALKVMCNGDDIISFAERYGADRTAARLQRSIGKVRITDVAKVQKVNVNFNVSP